MALKNFVPLLLLPVFLLNCDPVEPSHIKPRIITEKVPHDSDDPAIWYNAMNPEESLVLGTDKGSDGGLYVFDLSGKIDHTKTRLLPSPNNVDIEYGFNLGGNLIDIAAVTVRGTDQIRIYKVPGMTEVDNGGIDVFVGETQRDPMGISLYKRPSDGIIYAIIGRKYGPRTDYLWQYRLEDDGNGHIRAIMVRKFGLFSGINEIEAIAVDDEREFIYYSDEGYGIHKYYADPDNINASVELALFGLNDFDQDCEGISIYRKADGTGYILISNQQNSSFCIYKREGVPGLPHQHTLIKEIYLEATESDGSEVLNAYLNSEFPFGLFVAMSDDRTFHYYAWEDIADRDMTISF